MVKYTSILFGEYFENFISEQVKSGKYLSASEFVRTALRLSEQRENKAKMLVNELRAGEKSGNNQNIHPSMDIEERLSE